MNLEEEIKLLREELRQTKEALSKALQRIKELEIYIAEKEMPSFVKEDANHRHEKTGQKPGHKGYTRHIPERIDFIKKVAIRKCSYCEGKLSEIQEGKQSFKNYV